MIIFYLKLILLTHVVSELQNRLNLCFIIINNYGNIFILI